MDGEKRTIVRTGLDLPLWPERHTADIPVRRRSSGNKSVLDYACNSSGLTRRIARRQAAQQSQQ